MRVLEAFQTLEDTTIECKDRLINTPKVNEALNVIKRRVNAKWRVRSFRSNLDQHPSPLGLGGDASEGQQQQLRVHFGGIYNCVRAAMIREIGRLDRLNLELARMPAWWRFTVDKFKTFNCGDVFS